MKHRSYLDPLTLKVIDDDKVRPAHDEFARAFTSRPSEVWKARQLLNGCNQSCDHPLGRRDIIQRNVVPDFMNLAPCLRRPGYLHVSGSSCGFPLTHFGGGNSWSEPKESNQAFIVSCGM